MSTLDAQLAAVLGFDRADVRLNQAGRLSEKQLRLAKGWSGGYVTGAVLGLGATFAVVAVAAWSMLARPFILGGLALSCALSIWYVATQRRRLKHAVVAKVTGPPQLAEISDAYVLVVNGRRFPITSTDFDRLKSMTLPPSLTIYFIDLEPAPLLLSATSYIG